MFNFHTTNANNIGCEGADINKRDPMGMTPVAMAAYWGQVEALRLLVDAGSTCLCFGQLQKPPLEIAGPGELARLDELQGLSELAGLGEMAGLGELVSLLSFSLVF